MKKKFVVIIALFGLLGYTVYKMMQFEESIRQDHIITHFVEDNSKPLIQNLNEQDIAGITAGINYHFRSGEKYFQFKNKIQNKWTPLFLKGVNLGVAVPGKFPAEFSLRFDQYVKWFEMIGQMHSNVIRIYTILPPDFYKALAYYNLRHQNNPLYIMHGVWAKVPKTEDYFDKAYTREFQKEIIDVIDVVHGRANLKKVPGKAHGVYTTDVSSYIIAYLLGREWEPKGVFHTIKEHDENSYEGTFVSLPQGNPMEVWLAKMMDFTFRYETQTYAQQRPVSFVNWLPLDPMYHNTEYIENKKVREYDNDLLQVDFKKFNPTQYNKAGIYAAYHVYPYYPDFIYTDHKYADAVNKQGEKDNFYAYLSDLKQHTPGMPLVIAEYGLPTSRGVSHFTPTGLNQGGHSEAAQAKKSLKITRDILDSGCAGAIYFEWADEWFKHNWLVMDFEVPFHHRKNWHNMENPEQNFGILSLENRSKTIDGKLTDWQKNTALYTNQTDSIFAHADPSYFYIASHLTDFDFSKNNLYIAIDTYDKEKGDKKLPFTKRNFDNGFEFVCSFNDPRHAKIQVDEPYSVFTDIYNDHIPVYASKSNRNGQYIDELMLVNRGRKSLTGQKFDSIINNRSPLQFGLSNIAENTNADWYWNAHTGIFELRLDWHLINISDPSHKYVLDDKEETRAIEASQTDGIRFYLFVTDKNNKIIKQLPGEKTAFYTWKNWETPTYTERLKPIYDSLKNYFKTVQIAPATTPANQQGATFEFADFYNDTQAAVSISFDHADYSQYEYAFPLINKYKLHASFAVLPKQMNNMPVMINLQNGEKRQLFGYVQAKAILAKGNELALETSQYDEQLLFSPELNKSFSSIHLDNPQKTAVNKSVFVRQIPKNNNLLTNYRHHDITYALINTQLHNRIIDSLLQQNKHQWSILSYNRIYKDSLTLRHLDSTALSQKYIHFDKYREQVRLARNTGYWIAPESKVYQYLYEKKHSQINVKHIGNQYFINIENRLNPNYFNQALTINFYTKAKLIKISGAITQGYFLNKTGHISFNALPNKIVKIEIIK